VPHEVEDIPDADELSRLVFFPHMYKPDEDLILLNVFEFPNGCGESLVWHKYAPTPEAIRAIGCGLEAEKQQVRPNVWYVGHVVATREAVCSVRDTRGTGFSVIHEPNSEGADQWHAEVKYKLVEGCAYGDLKKGEKGNLRIAIGRMFSPLREQKCSDEQATVSLTAVTRR
jgi:hypothetical protein